MKVQFTAGALIQLKIIRELGTVETGFLTGTDIGKYKIIKNLMPFRFNTKSINTIYPKVLNKTRDKLIGVFFVNRKIFLNQWFIENIIIKFVNSQPEIYFCEFNDKVKKITANRIQQSGRQ